MSFENYNKKKYAFGDFILSKTGGGGPMASINNIELNNSLIFKIKNLYSKIRGIYPFAPVRHIPLSYITDFFNIQKVDFFSLDVEGHEYDVLKGIDFKKLYIKKYICVEVRHFNKKKYFIY
jgi:FkbM family methyltransferase